MRRFTIFSFFLAVALLVSALPTVSQSNATITGTLTDPSGAAITGALISAASVQSTTTPIETRSDSAGAFTLTLPPGDYRLRVTHSHFARVEQEFTLAAGERREWNPRLQLERLSANVIVTAQADLLAAEHVTAPVDVISRAEIERRQQIFLGSALAAEPGFAIARTGRHGAVTSLFLNGGNSGFTKVLVDGTPINEPGGAVDFSNFTLTNVEKVEVVHGAASALFGTDAMTGVVQVFTQRGSTARPQIELLGEGGRFETARGLIRASGLVNRFDYSAAVSRFNTGGQGPNDSFRNTTLSGNFGWQLPGTHRLRLSLRSAASDAGIPGQTELIPPDLTEHNALRDFSANLSWEFQTGTRWSHRISGRESYDRQIFDDPTSDFCPSLFVCDFPFTVRNQFNRAGLHTQSTYTGARGGLALGYEYEVENGFFNGPHGRRNNQGGYVEGRWQPLARLTVLGGFRAEGNDSFGVKVVPRAGASFMARDGNGAIGATRLRFNYGLGIKEPSLAQSFAQDACFPGNTALRAERSRAFNAGGEQFFAGDRLRVSVDFFHNRFRDLISFAFGQFPGAPPSPAACPFGFGSFFNTDLARARGLNTAVEIRTPRWLQISGHYSFTDSHVLVSPNAFDPALIVGQRLLRRPVHSGNLIFNVNYRRMNWNLANYFVGRRTDSDFLGFGLTRNPGYARVDLAGSFDLRYGLTAFGRVENVFDRRYQETLGFPALRRGYMLGMRYIVNSE